MGITVVDTHADHASGTSVRTQACPTGTMICTPLHSLSECRRLVHEGIRIANIQCTAFRGPVYHGRDNSINDEVHLLMLCQALTMP